MRILAIDTSCDDSCAAIVDTTAWKCLAEKVHSHVDCMRRFGGVVPEIASREHLRGLPLAVNEALAQAKLELSDIDWFAVTNRPGLVGALLVGVSFTKALAFACGKPFSALSHIEAHLFSPLLASFENSDPAPLFPWIALVVSGGHTELFLVRRPFDYQWLGGTLDDAAGEAFDKVGKLLGLPYPAGPVIDRMVAQAGMTEPRTRYRFPRAKTEGLDFSFSGLKTAVALQIKKMPSLSEDDKLGIAGSAQEAILDALVDKVRAARRQYRGNLVVTGGVACNSRLRAKLPDAYFPHPRHCSDNAAMVGLVAALAEREGKLVPSPFATTAHPGID